MTIALILIKSWTIRNSDLSFSINNSNQNNNSNLLKKSNWTPMDQWSNSSSSNRCTRRLWREMAVKMTTTMNSSITTTRIYLWTALSLSQTVSLRKKTRMRTMKRTVVTTMISTNCRTMEVITKSSSERILCSHRTHRNILRSLRSSRDRQLA